MRGGHVESRKSAVAWAMRHRSVSLPRSSNRTGGFPASGFPIGFTMEHTDKKPDCKRVLRSMFPVLHSLIQQPPTGPVVDGVARLIASPRPLHLGKHTESQGHWDRNRARLAVGEGFPFLLFRLQDGFTVPPWLTFPEAPLYSRTARFPGSGLKPWLSSEGLPKS